MRRQIYFAASLFNLRERLFNQELTDLLEEQGYKVFLPQRDGYEFSSLIPILSEYIGENAELAMSDLIYALDIGYFIPNSDIILANYDEPQDEGVIHEMDIAKSIGKSTIIYRTDTRAKYGLHSDSSAGIHSFPLRFTDKFIVQDMTDDPTEDIINLKDEIIKQIKTLPPQKPYFFHDKKLEEIYKVSKDIFSDVENINSPESIAQITRRYIQNMNLFEKSRLKIIRI
jgi:nucleoside 2-deoxyribosyltransferase